MARSMWRGAIQFGLVTIPVKLYLATETGGIGFNLLHASCLNRIQMKIYCPYHDEVVPRSETVRGYEYTKGKYVVVSDEDIDSVPLKTMRAIEIELFINASRDSQGTQFVKQAYYLEPEQIGAKAFYLLKSVLADQNKSAICKIVLKDREQLAALNPFAKTMLLTTLHWPDEVRAVDELNLPEDQIEIKPSEKKMAEQLVASMTGEFSADDYQDDYRQALMKVIERKVAGEKPEPAAARAEPTNITDLMAALEASVSAAREDRKAAAKADEKPARAAAKPAKGATPKPASTAAKAKAKAKAKSEAEESEAEPPRQRRRKTA
ncbi:MAG TPA: Ku protein [Candidatus Limnocylindrales bacterium]|nr:Ku protein [Candidatus Limnocylindrales bacterium]